MEVTNKQRTYYASHVMENNQYNLIWYFRASSIPRDWLFPGFTNKAYTYNITTKVTKALIIRPY